MKAAVLVKQLEEAGWKFVRQSGTSHAIYKHPDNPMILSIPMHGKKDLKPGLLNDIRRIAGLK